MNNLRIRNCWKWSSEQWAFVIVDVICCHLVDPGLRAIRKRYHSHPGGIHWNWNATNKAWNETNLKQESF